MHIALLLLKIETSSRNSEVIHAGIYYPPTSLKAKLCVQGKRLLYDYCKSRNIPYDRKGKLIVATDHNQYMHNLQKIRDNAIQCGVYDLQLLSKHDVQQNFEPNVDCHGALFSPSTGVIDSHTYMVSLLADAENYAGNVTCVLNTNVEKVSYDDNKTLSVQAEGMKLVCENVINCAGLKAADIANMVFQSAWNRNNSNNNVNSIKKKARQYFAKGNYFRLQGQTSPFNHLVYPVPEKGGLGVHATIDLGGITRFGPDVEWIDQNVMDADRIDLTVDPTRCERFYAEIRKYWPELKDGSLVPDYCGVRPKLAHSTSSNGLTAKAVDFMIETEIDHGIKWFVNMQGIESPGLTSSLAIAEFVKDCILKK